MSIRGTIARNTAFNALGRAWEFAAGLFLTWYIVQRTGLDGLGLWSIVLAATGYAALADLGLSSGFARFIAEHHARGDRDALAAVVATGTAFYAALGACVAAAGWLAVPPALAWLQVDAGARSEVQYLLRGALLVFAAGQMLAPLQAVPAGLQRMGIVNLAGAAASVAKIAATVLFLESGHGVRGLLYAHAAVLAAQAALGVPAACIAAPGLRIGLRHVRRSTFGALLGFGWRSQIARLANLVNFQTDRLAIAWFFRDTAAVGAYRLGEELAGKMRQAPALLVTALVPAAADLDARDDRQRLRLLCLVSTKYMAAVTVPMTFFALGASGTLLHAWLGDVGGVEGAARVARILIAGYAANLLAGPAMGVALGMGRADLAMHAGLISTAINLALTLAFALPFGVTGIAAATAIGMIASAAWFFARLEALVGLRPAALLRHALLWPALAALPVFAAAAAAGYAVAGRTGHLPNLIAAAAAAALGAAAYLAALRATPFLDDFDRRVLGAAFRALRMPGARLLLGAPRL